MKTTEAGGERGYDAGKKVNGRKRHILVALQDYLVRAGGVEPEPDSLAHRLVPWQRIRRGE